MYYLLFAIVLFTYPLQSSANTCGNYTTCPSCGWGVHYNNDNIASLMWNTSEAFTQFRANVKQAVSILEVSNIIMNILTK
jgi:hypothetical protein